ncbi:hypothetical protein CXR04_09605 [Streptomyces sp. CMB-StM0423]|nr:hypothetical protein CXR04_09605 [Streptomyces sp. CMB-StM0423]
MSPLFTIVGVIIGSGVTLLVEQWRWQRDHQREAKQILRETFVSYLTHTARAHESMRQVSEGVHSSPDERRLAILAAFTEANVYEERFRLTMLAPTHVVELAVHSFRKCRAVRDLLASGTETSDDAFRSAQLEYFRAVQATSDAMRKELGIPKLLFVPLGYPPDQPPVTPL